ncbi:hypothetical protein KDK95_31205 [Actinospica sp. MGRD01-02]|uniref:Uncharacterized protein n=1 Tax=Actinospica acidithermotolerans TaxID=2828514 RepID=A0A941EHD3_9ACTN|nr:hypothetical protein [Actinospica acidithermotolerans]MBR7830813.1 hypothetical protein [Actinospica acidithermotolerans]
MQAGPQWCTLVFRYAPARHTIPAKPCDRANPYALEDTTTALDLLAGHAQAFLGESSHVSSVPVAAHA